MKYHNITHNDILNGKGLRIVLWLSGCDHHCNGCQNQFTWDSQCGLQFDKKAKEEIFSELDNDYIDGITFSGGDPFYESNISEVCQLIKDIKNKYQNKTIWIYTGYTLEELLNMTKHTKHSDLLECLYNIDVLVDGKFEKNKSDINYHWAGSTNQRVIDVKESLKKNKVITLNF